jgi:hypothetical protein
LVNLELLERPGFLQASQIHDDFKDGAATFALMVRRPKLLENRGSAGVDDGSCVPVVVVEESRESVWVFGWGAFWSWVAVGLKECGE